MAEGADFVCCRGACQTKAQDLAKRRDEQEQTWAKSNEAWVKSREELMRLANRASPWSFYTKVLGAFLLLTTFVLGEKNEPITSVLGVVGVSLLLGGLIASLRRKKRGA
jgi:LPXTG-motif cell wall-anchored protein